MHTISREAYEFLKQTYEENVERFFDDPLEYADGDPLRQVYKELKELGEELEIDINSLAIDDDLDRFEQFVKNEDGEEISSKDYISPDHVDMDFQFSDYPQHVPVQINKKVEDKLKELSTRRQEQELIGEWVTYEIEND